MPHPLQHLILSDLKKNLLYWTCKFRYSYSSFILTFCNIMIFSMLIWSFLLASIRKTIYYEKRWGFLMRVLAEVHYRIQSWVSLYVQENRVCSGLGVIKQGQFSDLVSWTKSRRGEEWNAAKPLVGKIPVGIHGDTEKMVLVHYCGLYCFIVSIGRNLSSCLTWVLL